jgi:Holliday junction resolvase-like predicted endonuclease
MNVIASEIGAEGRQLLDEIFRRSGDVSGADLGALVPGGLFHAVAKLEELSRQDALLRMEAVDGAAFSLSPTVSRSLGTLRSRRERLLALWEDAVKATDKQVRGKALEDFAGAFFSEAFEIVERNLRTDTEEIDLVLAPGPLTDARFRKSLHLFVECKNWRTERVDQKVVSALAGKLQGHSFVQGFVLATGVITEDARRQAENLAMAGVDIVLLDGVTVRSFLEQVRPIRDLLVEQHSRLLLRKR